MREMMERLKIQNELETTPRPCEWFDMIAGSNTGGCVANIYFLHRLHTNKNRTQNHRSLPRALTNDCRRGNQGLHFPL